MSMNDFAIQVFIGVLIGFFVGIVYENLFYGLMYYIGHMSLIVLVRIDQTLDKIKENTRKPVI